MNKNPEKWRESFKSLENALERLSEVLKEGRDPKRFLIDSSIQRFEFTFELFWKNLKRFVQDAGYPVNSPRETLQKAFALGWINDEKLWLSMLEDRNITSHVYQEKLADQIYDRICQYYPIMRKAYEFLQKGFL